MIILRTLSVCPNAILHNWFRSVFSVNGVSAKNGMRIEKNIAEKAAMGAYKVKLDNLKPNNGSSKEHFLLLKFTCYSPHIGLWFEEIMAVVCNFIEHLAGHLSFPFIVRPYFIVFSTFFFNYFLYISFSSVFHLFLCKVKSDYHKKWSTFWRSKNSL